MVSKQCCLNDAYGGCIWADDCQTLMFHELGAFLAVNARYTSHCQQTCILRPTWVPFTVDLTRSTQQDHNVSCMLQAGTY